MAKTRPDDNISIMVRRVDGVWTTFLVYFEEELTDGVHEPIRENKENVYAIADLPAQVRADLLSAYNGMVAHRDSFTPIT